MQLGVDHPSKGGKLGIEGFNPGSDVVLDILHFGIDEGMHVFIDGVNVGINLSHFFLGFCEIIVQGIEARFQVLATGVGHDEGETR